VTSARKGLEILFYIVSAASFGRGLNRHTLVSPNCSRKSFFAKLGGLLVAAGIVPKIFAKSERASAAPSTSPVSLRSEPRAVVRQDGTF
jgi:hypothetical protein